MKPLTEFLNARLDEAEPGAEVDSKRQILTAVDALFEEAERDRERGGVEWLAIVKPARAILRALAAPYADHPDHPHREG